MSVNRFHSVGMVAVMEKIEHAGFNPSTGLASSQMLQISSSHSRNFSTCLDGLNFGTIDKIIVFGCMFPSPGNLKDIALLIKKT